MEHTLMSLEQNLQLTVTTGLKRQCVRLTIFLYTLNGYYVELDSSAHLSRSEKEKY